MKLSDCMAVMIVDPATQKAILIYKSDKGKLIEIVGGKDGHINLRNLEN